MSLVVLLIALATAIDGLLSGLNLDMALVRIPCTPGTGALAYATFACGNDVRTGPFISPLLGKDAALLTVLATTFAFVLIERKSVFVV